jgi:4-amino-4-deoxy-L-arabinose transferase-like glycosyltransferase
VLTLWRVTPVVLVGLAFALLAVLFPRRLSMSPERRRLVQVLLGFSLLFTVFMSLGAKKFDRYLLPVFAPLDIVAGLGWLSLLEALGRITKNGREAARWLLLGAVILGQLFGVLQTAPYYFNYYNPLMGGHRKAAEVLLAGWGEGLDQAARYLTATPHTVKTRAIAWYGDGCFSYFFDGTTVPVGLDMTLKDLRKTDYVVLYRNQWQRQMPSPEFIAYFEQLTPEYVVRIDGIEYVRVYNLREVP